MAQGSDAPADELAAALKSVLGRGAAAATAAQQAQRAYHEQLRAAAEAAVSAAEAAGGGEPLLSVAACCAGAVEGFTPAQVGALAHVLANCGFLWVLLAWEGAWLWKMLGKLWPAADHFPAPTCLPPTQQVCLHPLVAARHDSGALLGALRQLSAREALALLRYLRTLLRNYAALIGRRANGVGRARVHSGCCAHSGKLWPSSSARAAALSRASNKHG